MSLLTPDAGLLFWMILSFGIVFVILSKYGFPVIIKAVEQRKEYIDHSSNHSARQTNNLPASRPKAKRFLPRQESSRMRF